MSVAIFLYFKLTVIHPTLSEAINDIDDKDGKMIANEQKKEKEMKMYAHHLPSKVLHRQVNIHGVPQGVSPNVYNLDHEGYLLGIASQTHSKFHINHGYQRSN